jgi:hypothetical protein
VKKTKKKNKENKEGMCFQIIIANILSLEMYDLFKNILFSPFTFLSSVFKAAASFSA